LKTKKAKEIVILEIKPYLVITDYFILASSPSKKQLKALTQAVEEEAAEKKVASIGKEGTEESGWILLDYGDVVVHLFEDELREYYRLESLWKEANRIELTEVEV
jgi:ribosome-associated protein